MPKLTQEEFTAHQNALDAALRATKRGTPERVAVEKKITIWEEAIAMPDRTVDQRTARHEAIFKAREASR